MIERRTAVNKKKLKVVMKRVGWGLLIAIVVLIAMVRQRWLEDVLVGALALIAVPLLLLLGALFPDLSIDLL